MSTHRSVGLILMLLSLMLGGCCSHGSLTVKHQFIDNSYLASSHVGTPDPRLCWGYCGQQLIINWSVPRCYLDYPDLHLLLTLRLRNQQVRELRVPIDQRWGRYVYSLLNCDYSETGGLLTYKVEVRTQDSVLETWNHQVWTELIECPI